MGTNFAAVRPPAGNTGFVLTWLGLAWVVWALLVSPTVVSPRKPRPSAGSCRGAPGALSLLLGSWSRCDSLLDEAALDEASGNTATLECPFHPAVSQVQVLRGVTDPDAGGQVPGRGGDPGEECGFLRRPAQARRPVCTSRAGVGAVYSFRSLVLYFPYIQNLYMLTLSCIYILCFNILDIFKCIFIYCVFHIYKIV